MSYTKVNFTQSDIDIIFDLCQTALDFSRAAPDRAAYDTWHGSLLTLSPMYEEVVDMLPHYFEIKQPKAE